jgi:hypothetical protein
MLLNVELTLERLVAMRVVNVQSWEENNPEADALDKILEFAEDNKSADKINARLFGRNFYPYN